MYRLTRTCHERAMVITKKIAREAQLMAATEEAAMVIPSDPKIGPSASYCEKTHSRISLVYTTLELVVLLEPRYIPYNLTDRKHCAFGVGMGAAFATVRIDGLQLL